MSLKPLNDRVLVKRLESEERTASGLYIPDTAKEKPSKGEVVAVGPGKHADDGKLVPMTVKVGDMVLFNKYAGTEVKIDGAEHLVMREDDILAIIAWQPDFFCCDRTSFYFRTFWRIFSWLPKKFCLTPKPVKNCPAAWTSSPTPSRSPSAPRVATS